MNHPAPDPDDVLQQWVASKRDAAVPDRFAAGVLARLGARPHPEGWLARSVQTPGRLMALVAAASVVCLVRLAVVAALLWNE